MTKKTLYKIIAVVIALLVWQGVAMLVHMDMLLASPVQVAVRLFQLIFTKAFWTTVLFSMLRIMAGFLLAFVLAFFAALLASKSEFVEALFWPYVTVFKAVPIASFIILFFIWFSTTIVTILVAFLIAFPVIYLNTLSGLKSADGKLLEMAKIYRFTPWNRFRAIYLPSVRPHLYSAVAASIGMAWKAGVAAEVICVIRGSIGEMLYNAKIYFENADLLAWTVVIILLSVGLEKLVLWLLRLTMGKEAV